LRGRIEIDPLRASTGRPARKSSRSLENPFIPESRSRGSRAIACITTASRLRGMARFTLPGGTGREDWNRRKSSSIASWG